MFHLYISSALFFTAGVFAFADEPSSALNKHSVDTVAVYQQAEALRREVSAEKRQQAQKREEKIKLERRQERQSLASLEARRKALRKQLEDGVEAMYQEALSLYKQGDYTAAADKFKDVQDVLPGYKSAGQYMDEARLKSLTVNPPPPSASRQNAVFKALDLFGSNAK